VAWVGVHCDAAIAHQREASRPDPDAGMAAVQARQVHQDVAYDVQVDSSGTGAGQCARAVVTSLRLA
jgi:chloramphenicol 3-O phosphotransferase